MSAELKNNPRETLSDGRENAATHAATPFISWRRRPLSGLRWQLTFFYSLLLCVLLIAFSIITSYAISSYRGSGVFFSIQLTTVVLIILGILALFALTNFLLHPLRRMTDAAQTIALGDLQQRERLVPLMQGDDEVSKIASSLNAMVDQLEKANKAEQASKQRFRRFFSDASHQLRTPLTSIRGFTEVLMRGAKDDPETATRVLKLMKTEAERMTRLVNDLLLISRLDGEQELELQDIDLIEIAVEGVEQAKVLANDGRKVTLHFATQDRLGVKANSDRIKQVLHILFDNAIKYGRPGPEGYIRLQLETQNGHALMKVIDNGHGVHPDDLPFIFDHFYRGEHMAKYEAPWTQPIGTGLGLSIARAIIHAHKGDITVISTPDTETVFTVKLPRIRK